MRQILVFGMEGIKPIVIGENEVIFADDDSSDYFANYDMMIYCVGAFKYRYQKGFFNQPILADVPAEAIRRENEIHSALEKGRIVCIIGFNANDYVASGVLKSYDIYNSYIHERDIHRNLTVKRSEFKSFLDDVGATQIGFDENSVDETICCANDIIAGFSKRIEKGMLLFLPCIWGSTDITYIIDHFKRLVTGLVSYLTKLNLEPPRFLDQFKFTKERETQDKMNRLLDEQIAPLKTQLGHYSGLKSILWLGDKYLVRAVDEFLRNLGLETCIDDIGEEDLWIMNEKEKLVIVEVKGLNNNLTRVDVAKLDQHREARRVPNLTGLLIANTFMGANSLGEKDQPFPPNVVERAVSSSLLITRTIDLCKILDYLEGKETEPAQMLLDRLIGQKGWLTFKDGKIEISC